MGRLVFILGLLIFSTLAFSTLVDEAITAPVETESTPEPNEPPESIPEEEEEEDDEEEEGPCDQEFAVHGDCRGLFERFSYNKDNGKCEKFEYGGCSESKNNFESLAACQDECGAEPNGPSESTPPVDPVPQDLISLYSAPL